MRDGASEAAEGAACRYCGRRFPDAREADAHVETLRRAGMLADHKAIHGKTRDPFRALDLEIDSGELGRVGASPEDDPTRMPAWVRTLLGRASEDE